jgi:hypothetical protein
VGPTATKERRPSKAPSAGSKDRSTELDGGDENCAPDESIDQLHPPKLSEEPELSGGASGHAHGLDGDSAGPPAYQGSHGEHANRDSRSSKS